MILTSLFFLLLVLCSSVSGYDDSDIRAQNNNLRLRELQQCNFRCPRNSSRKPNRRCYDTFDDCQCDPGFTRTGNSCIRIQDNCNFRCPRNSSRKPNRRCYDTFDDCQCDPGFTGTGNSCIRVGGRSCSEDKLVRVYKLCVNGDADGWEIGDGILTHGPEVEAKIFLDGEDHYPRRSSNCHQDPAGFCKWKEGICHKMEDSRFQSVEGHRSLTVGIQEFDKHSNDDNTNAFMPARDWYIDTCDKYEVILSRDFKSERKKEVCQDLGVSGRVRTPDGLGSIGVSAGIQSCTRWVDPPESYIWFLEVQPRR